MYSDGLLTMARWMNDDIFVHAWTNRIQNRGWITVFSRSLNQSWVVSSPKKIIT